MKSNFIGAATAFGLASLLPLNVPPSKPLMYCNDTDLTQSLIRIDNRNIYQCVNYEVREIFCSTLHENSQMIEINARSCENRTVECNGSEDDIYCTTGTLLSRNFHFCNSTIELIDKNLNETTTILNCYRGELPSSAASFIPTTTTQTPMTTEKPLSFGAQAHVFILKLMGNYDVLSTTQAPVTDYEDEVTTNEPESKWIPEALTIPPEPTTTTVAATTEAPYDWAIDLRPIGGQLIKTEFADSINELNEMFKRGGQDPIQMPEGYVKIPRNASLISD